MFGSAVAKNIDRAVVTRAGTNSSLRLSVVCGSVGLFSSLRIDESIQDGRSAALVVNG